MIYFIRSASILVTQRSSENLGLFLVTSIEKLTYSNTFTAEKQLTLEVVHKDGSKNEIKLNHTYNESQIEWFKEGSALNLIRKNEGL